LYVDPGYFEGESQCLIRNGATRNSAPPSAAAMTFLRP
jgi:hypothetical protein